MFFWVVLPLRRDFFGLVSKFERLAFLHLELSRFCIENLDLEVIWVKYINILFIINIHLKIHACIKSLGIGNFYGLFSKSNQFISKGS